MKINEKLKKERIKKKMTQKEFADYLGINYTSYFQYEQGFKIGIRNLRKIMEKIKIDVKDIL